MISKLILFFLSNRTPPLAEKKIDTDQFFSPGQRFLYIKEKNRTAIALIVLCVYVYV